MTFVITKTMISECVSCGEDWKSHNRCRLKACKTQWKDDFYGFRLK